MLPSTDGFHAWSATKTSPEKDSIRSGAGQRASETFFQSGPCAGCHEDVVQGLGNGTHAGKPVKDPNEYRVCITCHDPHRQPDSSKLSLGFDLSKSVEAQCSVCHAAKAALPALSSADEKCMACHGSVAGSGPGKVASFCFECHGDKKGPASSAPPVIGVQAYGSSTHAAQSCLACHPKSAQFGHAGQERTNCLACHQRHDEKVAHDAHMGVSCEACHLSGVTPIRERKKRRRALADGRQTRTAEQRPQYDPQAG